MQIEWRFKLDRFSEGYYHGFAPPTFLYRTALSRIEISTVDSGLACLNNIKYNQAINFARENLVKIILAEIEKTLMEAMSENDTINGYTRKETAEFHTSRST